MKKTYQKPTIETVLVNTEKMFCESLGLGGNSGNTTSNTEDLLGRGGSDWDDED